MAQNGPITAQHANASALTLTPMYKEGLISVYNDRSVAAGLQTELSLGMRKPRAGQNDKITLKVSLPYEVVANDLTTVETVTGFIDIVVPPTATVATRRELVAAISSLFADTIVDDLVINNGFPY